MIKQASFRSPYILAGPVAPTNVIITAMQISPSKILRGRNIFFVGGTGFLGKVTLSMLLERFPDIGKIYLMVRAGSGDDSEERFWNNVFTSPAFDPIRERYGDQVQKYLSEKLVIVGGDITHDNLGYTE